THTIISHTPPWRPEHHTHTLSFHTHTHLTGGQSTTHTHTIISHTHTHTSLEARAPHTHTHYWLTPSFIKMGIKQRRKKSPPRHSHTVLLSFSHTHTHTHTVLLSLPHTHTQTNECESYW